MVNPSRIRLEVPLARRLRNSSVTVAILFCMFKLLLTQNLKSLRPSCIPTTCPALLP